MGKGSLLERLGLRRPRLTFEAFREAVIVAIRLREPNARVTINDDGAIETWLCDDGPWTTQTSRAYGYYLATPRRLDQIVQRLTEIIGRPDIVPTVDALIALVRPDAYDPARNPRGNGPGLTREIAGDLIGIVAIDGPDAYVFRSRRELCNELAMSECEIWQTALANTRPLLPSSLPLPTPGQIGALSVAYGCAASALLFDELWDELEARLGAPILVAAAEHNIVLMSREDADGYAAMTRALRVAATEPARLWPHLLRRRNGRWEAVD